MLNGKTVLTIKTFIFAFAYILVLVVSDAEAAKLYASLSDRLIVIDTETNTIDKTILIPANAGFTGIGRGTLGPDQRTAYFTTSNQNGVVKFDTSTDTFGRFYPVSSVNPLRVGITLDEATMFVVDQRGPVRVVDTSSGNIIKQISVPTQNFDGVMSLDGTKFYVPHRDRNFVSVISTSSLTVTNTIPTVQSAHNMVINSTGARGYVTNEFSNSVSCLNLTDDTFISSIAAQSHPIRLDISSDDQTVFVGNRDSESITVMDALPCSTRSTLSNAAFGHGIRDLAYADNGHLYVVGTQTSATIPPIAVYDYNATTFSLTFDTSINPAAEIQSFLFVDQALPAPAAPTGLNAIVGNGSIYLKWDPAPLLIDEYHIDVEQKTGSVFIPIGTLSFTPRNVEIIDGVIAQDPGLLVALLPGGQPVNNNEVYRFRVTVEKDGFRSLPSSPTLAMPGGFTGTIPKPIHPLVFLHGHGGNGLFNGNGTFFETFDFMERTLRWSDGGLLLHQGSSLDTLTRDPLFSDFLRERFNPSGDFFRTNFGDDKADYPDLPINEDGLRHQGHEVDSFVNYLKSQKQNLDDIGNRFPITLIAHSNGGLAARSYFVDHPNNIAQDIFQLITYGTPHKGADIPLPTFIPCLTQGCRDARFDCNGQDVVVSPFLQRLDGVQLPDVIGGYTAIIGHSHNNIIRRGHRNQDCHSEHWDGLVPISSANLALVIPNIVQTLTTNHIHVGQGNDFPAIFCALNPSCFKVTAMSPVNIEIVAPDGRTLFHDLAAIPGASLMEIEDEIGHSIETALIPFPVGGDYKINVFPKQDALPTDTFTITATINGATTVIAQDMQIQDIPSGGFDVMVNSPPVVKCKNIFVAANDSCTATVNPSDVNDGSFDLNPGDTITLDLDSTELTGLGTHTVILTVTDNHGASSSCAATVTVVDNTPPTINCPSSISVGNNPGRCSAVVTYTATAVDNCDGAITPTCIPASGSSFPKGITTVHCSVADGSGNASNCSFTVKVNDTELPRISCPSPIVTSNDAGQCSAVVNFTVTASDNCPGVSAPACAPASGTAFSVGTTTVTCNTQDASSNSANCSFTVTVIDNQAPTLDCPGDIVKTTNRVGDTTVIVAYTEPSVAADTAGDNCAVANVVCSPPSGSAFPLGATTVTCTATDTSGNSTNCGFTVKVFDVCIEDDSNPGNALLFISTGPLAGEYLVCCGGATLTGRGTAGNKLGTISLVHFTSDRRVQGFLFANQNRGSAAIQVPPNQLPPCAINDSNTNNNSCGCSP